MNNHQDEQDDKKQPGFAVKSSIPTKAHVIWCKSGSELLIYA